MNSYTYFTKTSQVTSFKHYDDTIYENTKVFQMKENSKKENNLIFKWAKELHRHTDSQKIYEKMFNINHQ